MIVAQAKGQVVMQELMWYDEVLAAELRSGPITSFADRYLSHSCTSDSTGNTEHYGMSQSILHCTHIIQHC